MYLPKRRTATSWRNKSMKKQIRSYEVKTDEKPLVLEGMAIVFDRPAKIGEITE